MPIKRPETRYLVNLGYHKFLMPKGCTEEDVKGFFSALAIDNVYGNARGDYTLTVSPSAKMKVEVQLLCVDDMNTIYYNKDLNEVWKIIAEKVCRIIDDKGVKTPIRFESEKGDVKQVKVGDETLEFGELGDPKTDPDDIVKEIVECAKKQEKDWEL